MYLCVMGINLAREGSLTPSCFIEVSVPNQQNDRSCRDFDFVSFYNFSIGLRNCSDSVILFCFHCIQNFKLYKHHFV
jgi:hypothetical protein